MLQKESKIKIVDNSGAKEAKIININGHTGKRFAFVGEIIKAAVKKAVPGCTVKKSQIVDAVIVRTRKEYRRQDGSYIKFDDNAAVIIDNKSKEPVGTAIFGPVAREVKMNGFVKVASLAPEVL